MGCGMSSVKEREDNEGFKFDFSRRNTIVERPNVVVEIGKGVKKIDRDRRIVFIFGRSASCVVNYFTYCYCPLSVVSSGKISRSFLSVLL